MAKNTVKVVLLGTGYPFPDPERSGPSIAIIVNSSLYVIDAGPGVVRRLQEYINSTKNDAIAQRDLCTLFFTHLHSDHTLGLPDAIYTPWVMGRSVPFNIFGPPGTKAMVRNIQKAYEEDVHVRTTGLEKGDTTGYKTTVTEFSNGVIYKDEQIAVKAFRVKHGSWKHAYGFTITVGSKKIVISGDTKPHKNVVREGKDADLMIHEVASDTEYGKDKNWEKYMRNFHTSSSELAEIASQTNPKKLVLVHQIHRHVSATGLVKEIKKNYKGVVKYGKDLDVFTV
ncbi:MAG: MBL fold metallo-hydrolase [Candidatus Paceibacterota bacterium]